LLIRELWVGLDSRRQSYPLLFIRIFARFIIRSTFGVLLREITRSPFWSTARPVFRTLPPRWYVTGLMLSLLARSISSRPLSIRLSPAARTPPFQSRPFFGVLLDEDEDAGDELSVPLSS
jgi:hypothetical protein